MALGHGAGGVLCSTLGHKGMESIKWCCCMLATVSLTKANQVGI